MRYREKDVEVVPDRSAIQYYMCGQTPVDYYTEYTARKKGIRMWDTVIERYRKRSAAGEIFNNPMCVEEIDLFVQPARLEILIQSLPIPPGSTCYYNGRVYVPSVATEDFLLTSDRLSMGAFHAFLDEQFGEDTAIAVAKAYANVDESELLLLATLGELPETINFFVSILNRAVNILKGSISEKRAITKKFYVSRKDYMEALANFWMEMRYALRPLIYEIEGLEKALSKQLREIRQTARGRFISHDSETTTREVDFGSDFKATEVKTVSWTRTSRAGVLYAATPSDISWYSIFGLDQPLESIYELTKLSFVIDWIFNIGDILASWTPNAHLRHLATWSTEEYVKETNIQLTNLHRLAPAGFLFTTVESEIGSARSLHRYKRRVPNPTQPMFPQVRIKLDLAKLVDITLIARQVYRAFLRA